MGIPFVILFYLRIREAFKKKKRSKFGFYQTGGGYPPTKPIFFFFKEFSRVNRLIYNLKNMFCIL